MFGNLNSRVERLEEKASVTRERRFRLIKLCTSDDDVAEAHAEAGRLDIPTAEMLIIRLVPLLPINSAAT